MTTIVNNADGTIQGAVNALVANGNASVDFTNNGTVVGNLVFGAGDAALHFYTGSSLTGNLTAGTGHEHDQLQWVGKRHVFQPDREFPDDHKAG